MVLVGWSEGELGDMKVDKRLVVGLKPMPLHEHIEQRHSKGQMGLEVTPHTMTHPLEVAYSGEHGVDSLDEHASVPVVEAAYHQIGRVGTVWLCPLFGSAHFLALPTACVPACHNRVCLWQSRNRGPLPPPFAHQSWQ